MKLTVQRDHHLNLILRDAGGRLLRRLIGVPLMLWGALMLYGVFSSFVIRMSEEGLAGLPVALAGSLALVLFTALTLPLGYWMTFSRHWIVLKRGTRDIVQVSDWIFGRKERTTEVARFHQLRLALEPISSRPNAKSSSTFVNKLRLIAKDPERHPFIELGWMDRGLRQPFETLAVEIAGFLDLPLEIVPEDEMALSPAEEEAEREFSTEP